MRKMMMLQRLCQSMKMKKMVMVPSLAVGSNLVLRYSTYDKVSEMTEKARSTAEEFLRQAKEKKDEISEAAKETLDNSKEAVLGETQQGKERFKEKVERGDYDRIGRT
ncbi:hypothetical protein FCM35_KLT06195 [Carex littledalei]|uniref:Uncharacterized protein n=1 Tax=Carex littledalei TaxID=544730 RepID=A0A833QYX2_9POAL|nr:hypothetical protein FCM35_KLT06195 [Carex littledalei]